MDKQIITIYTEVKNGVIDKVSKSSLVTPKSEWNGKGIKWVDDRILVKKKLCG